MGIAMMDEEVKQRMIRSADETRRHFDLVAEEMRHHARLLLEGVIANGVAIDHLAAEMKAEFIETKTMIRTLGANLNLTAEHDGS